MTRDQVGQAPRGWAKRVTYDLSRLLARLVGILLFHIRCEGRGHVPADGGALICANHQSYLDPVLVGLACDRRLNYLARQSLFGFAPFRWLIRWYDAIPIEREGLGLAGLKETLRRLRRGEMVLLFPEGTRTINGEIGPLKPGITALARRGRVPLVPVAIVGAYQAWPRTRAFPMPTPIGIQFGPPISPEEIEVLSDDALMARLREALLSCQAAARYHQTPWPVHVRTSQAHPFNARPHELDLASHHHRSQLSSLLPRLLGVLGSVRLLSFPSAAFVVPAWNDAGGGRVSFFALGVSPAVENPMLRIGFHGRPPVGSEAIERSSPFGSRFAGHST